MSAVAVSATREDRRMTADVFNMTTAPTQPDDASAKPMFKVPDATSANLVSGI